MDSINKLILAFVTLIVGAVLIGSIAGNTQDTTTLNLANSEVHAMTASALGDNHVNETAIYTVTYPPTTWKINDCPLTNFVLKNVSGTTLTLTTDYTVTPSTGKYQLVNSTATVAGLRSNNTYVTYNYCGDDYLNSSWGRTVLNLVAGFFAIAMLMVSLALFYGVAKDTGLM